MASRAPMEGYNGTMKALLLGGNSQRHYVWIRQLGAALHTHGHDVVLQDYAHWEIGGPLADLNREIELAAKLMRNDGGYVVIAKGIGTLIAALATFRGLLRPSRIVMLGVPYDGIDGQTPEFSPSLPSLPPTVFIQNEFDPYGSSESLELLLKNFPPAEYEVVTVPENDTHDYLDFELISQYLK